MMIKRPDRKLFSLFFLVLLLGLKSLSYHPLSHTAEEDLPNCELCEVVLIQEYTPLLLISETALPIVHFLTDIPLPQVSETAPISSFDGYYYGRPPPAS